MGSNKLFQDKFSYQVNRMDLMLINRVLQGATQDFTLDHLSHLIYKHILLDLVLKLEKKQYENKLKIKLNLSIPEAIVMYKYLKPSCFIKASSAGQFAVINPLLTEIESKIL